MTVWKLGELQPRIEDSAFVHPAAQVIGDVVIHTGASVWPGAVLRGDFGRIEVGSGSSVQDNTVVHPGPANPTIIGEDCVVGHAAHLEGVVIEPAVLIGSGAILLQGVRVCSGGSVAAGALLPKGFEVPPDTRAQGTPARLVPVAGDCDAVRAGAQHYRRLAARYLDEMSAVPSG